MARFWFVVGVLTKITALEAAVCPQNGSQALPPPRLPLGGGEQFSAFVVVYYGSQILFIDGLSGSICVHMLCYTHIYSCAHLHKLALSCRAAERLLKINKFPVKFSEPTKKHTLKCHKQLCHNFDN